MEHVKVYVQPVGMMFGISSIVPNTNIDGNDLHDCEINR